MIRKIVLVFGLLVSSNSFAAYTWSGDGKVTEFETVANGDGWYLKTDVPNINPANCGQTSVYAADRSEHTSIILMALASGRKINVAIHNTECAFDKPKIERVRIGSN